MQTQEAREKFPATPHWWLPSSFSDMVLDVGNSVEEIDNTIFGKDRNFRGLVSSCRTITVPMNDSGHWFLCIVYLLEWRIVISGAVYDKDTWARRVNMALTMVHKLEQIAAGWDSKKLLVHNWTEKFRIEDDPRAPRQIKLDESGLYSILHMIDGVPSKFLREYESIEARNRVAVALYRSRGNEIAWGKQVSFLIEFEGKEYYLQHWESALITASRVLKHVVSIVEAESKAAEGAMPKLKGYNPEWPESWVAIESDLDLHLLVAKYTSVGRTLVRIKFELGIQLQATPNNRNSSALSSGVSPQQDYNSISCSRKLILKHNEKCFFCLVSGCLIYFENLQIISFFWAF